MKDICIVDADNYKQLYYLIYSLEIRPYNHLKNIQILLKICIKEIAKN